MKRIIAFVIVSMMVAPSSFAADPTVDEILDKYVQALGGKAAIEKLTSRVSKGTLEVAAFNVGGAYELYEKAPGKSYSNGRIEGYGEVKQGFDGKTGWMQNPMIGLRELSGAGFEQSRRNADFYRALKLKGLYAKMEVKGREKVGEREAFVIEATPAAGGGGPEKLYFDTRNGLLVRMDTERDLGDQKISYQMSYDDYREVDGVKVAFLFKQVRSDLTVVFKLTEVKHNVAVEDAKFAKPAQ